MEEDLREVTRRTAEMLFGPPKQGEGVYVLWRQFDPELARHISMCFTGRLYARNVLPPWAFERTSPQLL